MGYGSSAPDYKQPATQPPTDTPHPVPTHQTARERKKALRDGSCTLTSVGRALGLRASRALTYSSITARCSPVAATPRAVPYTASSRPDLSDTSDCGGKGCMHVRIRRAGRRASDSRGGHPHAARQAVDACNLTPQTLQCQGRPHPPCRPTGQARARARAAGAPPRPRPPRAHPPPTGRAGPGRRGGGARPGGAGTAHRTPGRRVNRCDKCVHARTGVFGGCAAPRTPRGRRPSSLGAGVHPLGWPCTSGSCRMQACWGPQGQRVSPARNWAAHSTC